MLGYYISYDISKVLDKYEIDRANCVAETLKILNRYKCDRRLHYISRYCYFI